MKTSISTASLLAEERQIDVDLTACFDVDQPRTASETSGTSRSSPLGALDLKHLARRQREQPLTVPTCRSPSRTAQPSRSSAHHSSSSSSGRNLAWHQQCPGRAAPPPRAVSAARDAQDHARVVAGAPVDRPRLDRRWSTLAPSSSSDGLACVTHGSCRRARAASRRGPRAASPVGRGTAQALQSTMSTKTRWPCFDRRGLDDGAQRGGGATATADHACRSRPGRRKLEHDGTVALSHFFDLHLIRIVDEPSSEVLEQLTVARRGRCSTGDALGTQELLDRVGGLGAAGEPVLDPWPRRARSSTGWSGRCNARRSRSRDRRAWNADRRRQPAKWGSCVRRRA